MSVSVGTGLKGFILLLFMFSWLNILCEIPIVEGINDAMNEAHNKRNIHDGANIGIILFYLSRFGSELPMFSCLSCYEFPTLDRLGKV